MYVISSLIFTNQIVWKLRRWFTRGGQARLRGGLPGSERETMMKPSDSGCCPEEGVETTALRPGCQWAKQVSHRQAVSSSVGPELSTASHPWILPRGIWYATLFSLVDTMITCYHTFQARFKELDRSAAAASIALICNARKPNPWSDCSSHLQALLDFPINSLLFLSRSAVPIVGLPSTRTNHIQRRRRRRHLKLLGTKRTCAICCPIPTMPHLQENRTKIFHIKDMVREIHFSKISSVDTCRNKQNGVMKNGG